uniref:AAA+ ATPase domain-containing protein n=1 Tax=viral metagenome TaxID=1070528 RepID=A0A6C0B977_9ZZZZ
MSSIPWVEAYRPTNFDSVVLDPLNKQILKNIIETSYFPNLLLYGPPGTGKTTTIINLVNAYQEKINQKNKGLMIHLNASDERGIDIIRNQINQFVNSKSLFYDGMKFVILDEVDYMTKNAQQALRYLLQNYSNSVRFCLICNYISKIDEGLQNEFLRLRFNQLPQDDIVGFLSNIAKSEKLNIQQSSLKQIQSLYKSDIRSMINFMQSNQNILNFDFHIIDDSIWQQFFTMLQDKDNIKIMPQYLQEISQIYNMDKKNIIKNFMNYIIRNKKEVLTTDFLNFVENIMHYQECKNTHYIHYSISRLSTFLEKSS